MDNPLKAGIVRALERRGMVLAGGEANLTRLTGGGWNDVFRPRPPGSIGREVVYLGQQASLFPMMPEAETQALEALRGRKVAPEPVAFLKTENDLQGLGRPMLVYVYYPGQQWVAGVEPVAELFKRQHGLEPGNQRPLASEAGAILYQGDQLLTKLADDAWAQRLKARGRAAAAMPLAAAARSCTPMPGRETSSRAGRLAADRLALSRSAIRGRSLRLPVAGLPDHFQEPIAQHRRSRPLPAHYGDAVTAERLDLLWPRLFLPHARLLPPLRRGTAAPRSQAQRTLSQPSKRSSQCSRQTPTPPPSSAVRAGACAG
jgi:hypothetical protein